MFTRTFILFVVVAAFGCGGPSDARTYSGDHNAATEIREVSPREAQTSIMKPYSQFVDVRTADEYAGGHAARAINIPLDELGSAAGRLEKSEPVYLICETGNRSEQAAAVLKAAGFNNVLSIEGGTQAWKAAGLPIETRPPHMPPAK